MLKCPNCNELRDDTGSICPTCQVSLVKADNRIQAWGKESGRALLSALLLAPSVAFWVFALRYRIASNPTDVAVLSFEAYLLIGFIGGLVVHYSIHVVRGAGSSSSVVGSVLRAARSGLIGMIATPFILAFASGFFENSEASKVNTWLIAATIGYALGMGMHVIYQTYRTLGNLVVRRL